MHVGSLFDPRLSSPFISSFRLLRLPSTVRPQNQEQIGRILVRNLTQLSLHSKRHSGFVPRASLKVDAIPGSPTRTSSSRVVPLNLPPLKNVSLMFRICSQNLDGECYPASPPWSSTSTGASGAFLTTTPGTKWAGKSQSSVRDTRGHTLRRLRTQNCRRMPVLPIRM